MRIALIGMSGAGKSLWSSLLSRRGFDRFGCDEEIGRRLVDAGAIPDASMDSLGRWMGFPYQTGFPRREARYLSLETTVMDELLTGLEAGTPDDTSPPLVIDTTGSVIYTGESILRRLRQQAVVVYLSLAAQDCQRLCRAYVDQPRPVVWRQHYFKKKAERNQDALKRCYRGLIGDRQARYRQVAHLDIRCLPASHRPPDIDALLARVKAFLNHQRPSHAL
jgi:hypothetical protein